MKILAVDDDHLALELLSAALKSAGYLDVETAVSGAEALEKITNAPQHFDCFLLDIRMPGMDGIELCGRIRSLAQYRSAPVLMITAMSERSFIDEAFSAGAMDYISKPFDPLELGVRVRIVANLVQERRMSARRLNSLKHAGNPGTDQPNFAIADPIEIPDVPRMVGKLAMENYLFQLSRGKAFQSTAVAIAIEDFDSIFAGCTREEVFYLLADVADAISASLKHTTFLMSYYGYGEFVCVTKRGELAETDELDTAVNWTIEQMQLTKDSGEPFQIRMVIGDPCSPSLWSARQPLRMIDEALTSVARKRLSERMLRSRSTLQRIAHQVLKVG